MGKREGQTVTWKDPLEVEQYIKQVQQQANELISENRRLRKMHMAVVEQIVELMNVDLLRSKDVWKENMVKIRKSVETATKGKN